MVLSKSPHRNSSIHHLLLCHSIEAGFAFIISYTTEKINGENGHRGTKGPKDNVKAVRPDKTLGSWSETLPMHKHLGVYDDCSRCAGSGDDRSFSRPGLVFFSSSITFINLSTMSGSNCVPAFCLISVNAFSTVYAS